MYLYKNFMQNIYNQTVDLCIYIKFKYKVKKSI